MVSFCSYDSVISPALLYSDVHLRTCPFLFGCTQNMQTPEQGLVHVQGLEQGLVHVQRGRQLLDNHQYM